MPGNQRWHELEADRDWSERHLNMTGLLPIIRRVRRPLLPVEAPADAKPVVVPATTGSGVHMAQGEDVKRQQPKEKHGEATSSEPAS